MAPPFPRAVGSFVGRRAQLDRIARLFADEVLFVVYGVPGVGKSELCFRVVEEARRRPPWTDAGAIHLQVEPHYGIEHLLAALRSRLGAPPTGPASPDLDRDLAAVAHALEARPTLLFIDDAHLLDRESAGRALSYLSRHVRASRILVASRAELRSDPEAPAAVVTRLGPLDERETSELVRALAERLGGEAPSPAEVFARTRGSPFHIKRALAGDPGEGALERSLAALGADDRRRLLLASVMSGKLPVAPDDRRWDELARRFLVDIDRGAVLVHELVRSAALRGAGAGERREADRSAAEVYLERFRADPDRNQIDVVHAVHRLLSAGSAEEAWELVERWYRALATAGLDHLLLEDLAALSLRLPARATAIDLARARILVRRCRIAEAEEVLRALEADPEVAASGRWAALAGETALRGGSIARARELLERARDRAAGGLARFQAGLNLATALALSGEGEAARGLVRRAVPELNRSRAPHRASCGWTVAMSYALEERLREAAEAAREAASAIEDGGFEDLRLRLLALEAFCRAEVDEVAEAGRLAGEVQAAIERDGAVREPIANLYLGFVAHAEGRAVEAAEALADARGYFTAHGDQVYACIADYGLARARAAIGDVGGAATLAAESAERAAAAGLVGLAPRGGAECARLLADLGDLAGARARATEVLEDPHATPAARSRARGAAAVAAALAGKAGGDPPALDLDAAEVALYAGDLDAAIESANRARERAVRLGRRYDEAGAAALCALAYAAAGGAADGVLAARWSERGARLAAERGYPAVAARCALARAALAAGAGERERAEAILRAAFAVAPDALGLSRAALQAALQERSAAVPPGLSHLLGALGLRAQAPYLLFDRQGVRPISEGEVGRVCESRDLVVDAVRGRIFGARGVREVGGRSTGCKLLAALIAAGGRPLDAETLYCRVWDAPVYHSLRHRNTLYVAVNRLRKTLRRLLPEREVVETTPEGWRLVDGVDACVVDAADRGA